MTSSTPETTAARAAPDLVVHAGRQRLHAGDDVEVRGFGDLRLWSGGHAPGADVVVRVGARIVELIADAEGVAEWSARGLLGSVAGVVRVAVGDGNASGQGAGELGITLRVRPEKLAGQALEALVEELESVAEGLAQDSGGVGSIGLHRSHEGDLAALDRAVGLASSAAAAIRRRPIHRARERVTAVVREAGARSAADVRWLATHPVAALRAAASGREVGVSRERRADLDTLENRGVLSTYDHLHEAVSSMRALVQGELDRLVAARPAREAFLTEQGNLWLERDAPRARALERRLDQLLGLSAEIATTRTRSGLPDLRPRAARMVRTPRVDAEPAYWTTFRAFLLAEEATAARAAPVAAVVGTLDELWEQWCTVAVAAELGALLGHRAGALVEGGWFATLRRGEIARWQDRRRCVRLLYEPEYAFDGGDVRKLFPGRPWRPDLVIEVAWADGTVDLHVLDAKFRLGEDGYPPMDALQELWWKYGEGIGDAARRPLVQSLWVLWPGRRSKLVGPTMLQKDWPPERLRGGAIGLWPGEGRGDLVGVLGTVLGTVLGAG